MKPGLAELRKQGTLVSSFIDDSLLVDIDYISCMYSVIDMVSLVDSLGFIVHPKKSVRKPTQEIVYLGFVLNSKEMTVTRTPECAAKIQHAFHTLLQITKHITIDSKSGQSSGSACCQLCGCFVWTIILQTAGD